MRKIKLLQPNYTDFTGHLGLTEFVDGVSVNYISDTEVTRLLALWDCEAFDDETPEPELHNTVPSWHEDEYGNRTYVKDGVPMGVSEVEESVITVADQVDGIYTKEMLIEIADEKGIAGLRELAEPLGIKGNSIAVLIDRLLEVTSQSLKGNVAYE